MENDYEFEVLALRAENARLKADANQFWENWFQLCQQIGLLEDALLGSDEWENASIDDFVEFDPWWAPQEAATRLLKLTITNAELEKELEKVKTVYAFLRKNIEVMINTFEFDENAASESEKFLGMLSVAKFALSSTDRLVAATQLTPAPTDTE